MEKYQEPQMKVIEEETVDVITLSDGTLKPTPDDDGGSWGGFF